MDKYSGYPWAEKLKNSTTETVCKKLNDWFLEFGFPHDLISDNGPCYRERFAEWCFDKGINFTTSSPYNPQANGMAEISIKSVKKLLHACHENKECFRMALLEFRNCPRQDGFSPSMAFFGRRLKGVIPFIPQPLQSVENEDFSEIRLEQKEKMSSSGHELPPLNIGNEVLIQNQLTNLWDRSGKITDIVGHNERSYIISPHDGGASIRRNRRFLRLNSTLPSKNFSQNSQNDDLTVVSSPEPILRRSERLKKKSVSFQF